MTVVYSIEKVDAVIEVRVRGVADRDSVTRMWTDIVAACGEHACLSVLGFSNLDQGLKLDDALHNDEIIREAGVTPDMHIAWMQLNPAAAPMTELGITRIQNRTSAHIRLFDGENEARQWLAEQAASAD